MKFWIQPWDFTLLSNERQKNFELSWRGKKSLDRARKEICTYVRKILPWAKLSEVAYDTRIIPELVIILSNFCTTQKELTTVLKQNSFLREIQSLDWLQKFQDIIENDFDDQWWFDISHAHLLKDKWNTRQRLEQEEAKKLREQELERQAKEYLDGVWKLLQFFWFSNIKENRFFFFTKCELWNMLYMDEILEYVKDAQVEKLTDLDKDKFLFWYAEKIGYPTDPDNLLGLSVMIPSRPIKVTQEYLQ